MPWWVKVAADPYAGQAVQDHPATGITWSAQWERLHRGADAYSLVLGGVTGLLVGFLVFPQVQNTADELTPWLDHFITGQLPVWVTSFFMLLRLGFLMQSDLAYVRSVDGQAAHLLSHVLACAAAALAAWAICLPASVLGYWIGIAADTGFHDLSFLDAWFTNAAAIAMLAAGLRMAVVAVLLGLGSWLEMAWLDARARTSSSHDPSQAIVRSVLIGFMLVLAVELCALWLEH